MFNCFLFYILAASSLEINFIKANINTTKYDQVPSAMTGTFIFAKYQAMEPAFFASGEMRGHGRFEAMLNNIIQSIKAHKINLYVDYFTPAKSEFYFYHPDYNICYSNLVNDFVNYKHIFESQTIDKKYLYHSIPYTFYPILGRLAILKEKLPKIQKHYFLNTNIVNIKSLVDDPEFKTIQIEGMASGITRYIYQNPLQWSGIKAEYKYRVYRFVASDAIQVTLMLANKRMDWADMTSFDEYFMHKLKLNDKIIYLDYSHEHPELLDKNLIRPVIYSCTGKKNSQLKKIIAIINTKIKEMRTNYSFTQAILKQYAKDFNLPYIPPEKFYYFRENFRLKKKIDSGDFDLVIK